MRSYLVYQTLNMLFIVGTLQHYIIRQTFFKTNKVNYIFLASRIANDLSYKTQLHKI